MNDEETESQEVVITYDALFDILRNEKTRDDLQKLHNTFFQDVVTYLNEKESGLSKIQDQKSLFESDEREKKLHQIGNIKKILRDIYERREKKIINMALNKSRFASNIINTSSLLEEEKLFYSLLISLLDSQRDKILAKLISGEIPAVSKIEVTQTDENKEEQPKTEEKQQASFESADEIKKQDNVEQSQEVAGQKQEVVGQNQEAQQDSTQLLRFLTAVPQFMGEDMREYGPYEEEDVAKLPIGIAKLLIEKERAEEIKEG